MTWTREPPKVGAVQLYVGVKVDVAYLEHWQPEQIAAFFGGIAAVMAAQEASGSGPIEPPA